MMEDGLTLGGGHTMPSTDDASQNCTLEISMRVGGRLGGGRQRGKWDNYNSIINKTLKYFRNNKK